ncbi:hypothetical protein [Streptomyces africanus]|uniref:hypothetical protein n=1 Tax=Streptomyces africanus TaxID=231024 RepID=UPI000A3D2559|nr:hypothetical protein [Streptomyces africanus]
MRSARMLLATATATAALAIAAPAAYAQAMGDWDHDNTSNSREHHKDGKHDEPRGGMHTGGGALAAVTADDGDDPDHRKDGEHGKHEEHAKDEDHGKDSEHGDKHHKPHGGMDTGSGALAAVNSDDDWDQDSLGDDERGEDSWGDKQDEDPWGDKQEDHGKEEDHGKHDNGSWQGDKHDKPHGGMHTGGGALAAGPAVTAGGLAVLAVAGTGLYALRRQKASRGAV